ncbi:MAG: tRNA (adenosine(37)-N6)-threonylcarbamoyltransferase complex dimerization subunit type 1 TsaB [Tissierellia bacterium]|nr:tRNA (adenosine(37)-N6)-threonylcarbamoyltransferase complex dimerization subunit type 1 TsaB [Tissierellia bacterium]
MRVLGIDSSTFMLSMSLMEDDKLIFDVNIRQEKTMAESLQPTLAGLMKDQDLKIEDIDLYGIGVGPGSFTGLRIGVAAVKTFARIFDKKVVGVSSLRAMAHSLAGHKTIFPLVDARRDRCYRGIYSFSGERLERIKEDEAVHIEEIINEIREYEDVILLGDVFKQYGNYFDGDVKIAPANLFYPRASSIAILALEDYYNGIYSSPYEVEIEYLKPSQAERDRENA